MQYNKDSHINNVDDVIKFFRYIVDERNVNFNPDDMFEDYIPADGTNAFTPEECEIYNHLTKECFDICEKEEADIYEIAFELLNYKKTYAKSVWLSKLKAKVNLVEQGSLLSMSLQMWKTVMWFSFFSMIKRMLQPSKSMLSSNLCETWDLILNESIKGCIVFLIYFFCPSQDILGISVNHLYKRLNPQTA